MEQKYKVKGENIDEWMEELDDARKEIVLRLRTIIKEADTGISEVLKWHWPTYTLEGNIASIMLIADDHVNLQFFRGPLLADPKDRLAGTGKSMRHLKIFSPDEIMDEEILAWVRESIDINRGR